MAIIHMMEITFLWSAAGISIVDGVNKESPMEDSLWTDATVVWVCYDALQPHFSVLIISTKFSVHFGKIY